MSRNKWTITLGVIVLTIAASASLLLAQQPPAAAPAPQHLVIKICNWDGVVPKPALDGFKMPAGKWADLQKDGWQVESYLVAPNDDGGKNGFYAVLKK